MARVLVAGCGYVGGEAARRFAEQGHEVWGLRRSEGPLPAGVTPVRADLAAPESLVRLPAALDVVVYAVGSDDGSDAAYERAYVSGLRHLLAAPSLTAAPPRRVLFTSSTAVYTQTDGSWVDETSETTPTGPAQRVLEAERLLATLGPGRGVALRLGGIYGPGRTSLIESVRAGTASYRAGPPVYANRNHRDDCAAALVHLAFLDEPAPVYIGSDVSPSDRREVLTWLAERLGAPPPQDGAGERSRGGNKRCSSALLRATGFTFSYPSYREGYTALLESMDSSAVADPNDG